MSPQARLRLFRFIAVIGVPAVLLAGCEGLLRLTGVGRPASFLIPDTEPGWHRTNPDYLSLHLPGSFDLRPLNFRVRKAKPANTVRIVVLGESAAQGIPEPMFGFAQHLRAQLRARHPGTEIEVLNTGVVAINSHVVRAIARELADYAPDLFVVYLGNNEVVGPYAPGCSYLSAMPPRWVIRASVAVRSTRTGQLLGRWLARSAARGSAPAEWGGMAMFVDTAVRGDDPRLEKVYANFAANLDDIIAAGTAAGARVVVSTLVSNLSDCPPFLSLNRPDLPPAGRAEWERRFARGRLDWLLDDPAAARSSLEAALAIDPQHAEAAWLLARIELESGNIARARELFFASQRWDALRFRPDPRLNELIRAAARSGGARVTSPEKAPAVALVDAARELGADPASTVPPAGREILFEHVHLDWEGNYRLGRRLAGAAEELLGRRGFRNSANPWLSSDEAAAALGYTAHARAKVLRLNSYIVQQPPFTHQVTYPEDQARAARELAGATARARSPAALIGAEAGLRAAIARDPGNPFLAKLRQEVLDDRGDLEGALAELRRAQSLQPGNFALRTDEAIKLARLGRFDEAERILRDTYARSPPRDRLLMLPAFADLFIRTQRSADGRAFLSEALAPLPAASPAAAKVLVLRARLALLADNREAAVADFRAARAADPRNPEAVEGLFALLADRPDEARAEVLKAAAEQPLNHGNNLRAAVLTQSDPAASLGHLQAALRSGPVNAALVLRLARLQHEAGRPADTLHHLAVARRLAVLENDGPTAEEIMRLVEQLR